MQRHPRVRFVLGMVSALVGFAIACQDDSRSEAPSDADTPSDASGSDALLEEIVRAEDLTGELEIALLEFVADVAQAWAPLGDYWRKASRHSPGIVQARTWVEAE